MDLTEENAEEEITEITDSSARKWIILLVCGALVVCGLIFLIYTVMHWKYDGYTVNFSDTEESTGIYSYYSFNGTVLKTGSESALCVSGRNEIIWSDGYEMTDPTAVFCADYCAVYDKNGNVLRVYDENGLVAGIETNVPIKNAVVSGSGGAALLTDNDGDVRIDYYDNTGELVATIKSDIVQNGYPIAMSLSYDGVLLAVSYISITDGEYFSNVTFYNFGSEGKSRTNNIVAQFTYENELAGAVRFFEDGGSAAFTNNGFYIYRGKSIPEQSAFVETGGIIQSVLVHSNDIGIVYDSSEGEGMIVALYSSLGKEKMSVSLDFSYTDIYMDDEQIVFSNVGQLCLMRKNGSVKYNGTIDAMIKDIVPMEDNRFVIISDGVFSLMTLG